MSRTPNPVRLVRFPGQTFFSTLRRLLNWGGTLTESAEAAANSAP